MQVMVEDVMTRCPVAVSSEATVDEVLNTLVTEGLTAVYVTTAENRLAGVVTDYEILKHQVLGGDRGARAESLMNRSVSTVRPNESAVALCPQFREGSFVRIAVVDDDGHLIGNVSRRELLRMILAMEHAFAAADSPRPGSVRSVPAPRTIQVARKPLATV